MIVDTINNEKLNPIVTELFIRDRKLNIFLVFITQSYFKVPETLDYILPSYLSRKFQKNGTSTNCIKPFIRY